MGYYSKKLGGSRLRACYDAAPARVRQYLQAEIDFVARRLAPGSAVLELGCGYGRVAFELARVAGRVVGVDTAVDSLALAIEMTEPGVACHFVAMDAVALGFHDASFDAVVCVQNGVCAFNVDPLALFREALRVTRAGGSVVVSSYAQAFWPDRLEWFELQAERGLVGEIDRDATGAGVIVCKDGFRSGTMGPDGFIALCAQLGVSPSITEVDSSSVFCEVVVPPREVR